MLEMTHSGAEHSDAALICLLDRILVAYASARLYNSLHAVLCRKGHSVVEWEETVRTEYEAPEFNDYFNMIWEDLKGKEKMT